MDMSCSTPFLSRQLKAWGLLLIYNGINKPRAWNILARGLLSTGNNCPAIDFSWGGNIPFCTDGMVSSLATHCLCIPLENLPGYEAYRLGWWATGLIACECIVCFYIIYSGWEWEIFRVKIFLSTIIVQTFSACIVWFLSIIRSSLSPGILFFCEHFSVSFPS